MLAYALSPHEFRFLNGDHLVASNQLYPRDRPVSILDSTDVALVGPLCNGHRDTNQTIPRTTTNVSGANHPTGTPRHSRVHLGQVGGTELHGIALGRQGHEGTSTGYENTTVLVVVSIVEECEE